MKLLGGLLLPLLLFAAQPEYLWTTIINDEDIEYVADAELTPAGDVVLLGWKDAFEFYVAEYSLQGSRHWKLSCPEFQDMYDIQTITNQDSSIIVRGGGKDSTRYNWYLKLDAGGEIIDELAFPFGANYGYPRYMTIDSITSDGIVAAYLGSDRAAMPRLGGIDWGHQVCWSYDYPDIRSRKLEDDVILINEQELVLADQWCYNEAGIAVRCPNGVRNRLTFAQVSSPNGAEHVREYDIANGAIITQLHRLTDGYLLLGYSDPLNKPGIDLTTYAVKFDARGDTLWTGTFPVAVGYDDQSGPLNIVETIDGRIYLFFRHHGAGELESGFLISEISAEGQELSVEHYGGGEFMPERVLKISDREMLVVGHRAGNSRNLQTFFMCFRIE